MPDGAYHPPFGQADLTNCERELIHLAGSVQPHGCLLALSVPDLVLQQVSANAAAMIGLASSPETLAGQSLASLGGDAAERVARLIASHDLATPVPLQCRLGVPPRQFEGTVHRHAAGGLVLELEPAPPDASHLPTAHIDNAVLMRSVSAAVQRFSAAASLGTLADAVAQCIHDMTGYDRVMVYKFDPDGHGQIISEARDPRLDSLLGHHYPASDIPQRARALYVRTRVRVLVDVNYEPSRLVPELSPADGQPLDMSLCHLRSMSPLHLQYLKNMGVTATLVISIVRENRLWGLIAAHHHQPRHLRYAVRTACELLAEVISTRIAAIEKYAQAQIALLVRRMEQRLIEATSVEGDWRIALFRNPRTLLQPLEATGAALFQDGEILSAGEVPSTPEMRALIRWIDTRYQGAPFAVNALARENPAFEALTPIASGVLAVKISARRPEYIVWFRKEQLQTITWAGDPTKPTIGDSPLELSPRRSFAAWSEIVRGTAMPWTASELALARALGIALVDIVLQVHAVRLLIGEHQLRHVRGTVEASLEPVAIADAQGALLYANPAFEEMLAPAGGIDEAMPRTLAEIAERFLPEDEMPRTLALLHETRQACRSEGTLRRTGRDPLAVGLRAEPVPGRDGSPLGVVLMLADLSERRRTADAHRHLEESLAPGRHSDEVIRAILTNASLAAMDVADSPGDPSVAPLLGELEESTQRAQALYEHLRRFVPDE